MRTAHIGDGGPLPVVFRTRLESEWADLEAIESVSGALTAPSDEHIATGTDRVATVARQLCTLRAVAETSAEVFSAELFGTPTFDNARQLGARLVIVPGVCRFLDRLRINSCCLTSTAGHHGTQAPGPSEPSDGHQAHAQEGRPDDARRNRSKIAKPEETLVK